MRDEIGPSHECIICHKSATWPSVFLASIQNHYWVHEDCIREVFDFFFEADHDV